MSDDRSTSASDKPPPGNIQHGIHQALLAMIMELVAYLGQNNIIDTADFGKRLLAITEAPELNEAGRDFLRTFSEIMIKGSGR